MAVDVRTRRFTARLTELTMKDNAALAGFSSHAEHASTSELLRCIIEDVSGAVTDPAEWTVQERMHVKAMYLASTLEDGPDFAVADNAHFSDYLVAEVEHPGDTVTVGEYQVRQITGRIAESIERIEGEIEVSEYGHWLSCMVAACVITSDSGDTLPESDVDLDVFIHSRAQALMELPTTEYHALCDVLYSGQEKLMHLYHIVIAQTGGLAVAPKPKKQEAEAELPLARFPVDACICRLAKAMGGKPRRAG